jgi:hypothetical protein
MQPDRRVSARVLVKRGVEDDTPVRGMPGDLNHTCKWRSDLNREAPAKRSDQAKPIEMFQPAKRR